MGEICCLLQICCNFLERRQKLVAHYEGLGLKREYAEVCADDTITRVDAFLETWVGRILKALVEHAHKEKA